MAGLVNPIRNEFNFLNEEVYTGIDFLIEDAEDKLSKFRELIKQGHNRSPSNMENIKILRELINLENNSKNNVSKLKRINQNLKTSVQLNNSILKHTIFQKEIQDSLTKMINVINLIDNITDKNTNDAVNKIYENTMKSIDKIAFSSGS